MTTLTNLSLKVILQKLATLGWMAKWVIESSKFDIAIDLSSYEVQVLANFVSKYTIFEEKLTMEEPETLDGGSHWILHVDGASNSQGSGVGSSLQAWKEL